MVRQIGRIMILLAVIMTVTLMEVGGQIQQESVMVDHEAIQSVQDDLDQNWDEEEKTLITGLHAQSAVLMDADTGRILLGKAEDIVRPMASTTKIMTCILALEQGNLDDVVTASSYASSQPKVHLGAPAGRTFYLRDLLYSLMLESHNDTAVMIAEHIGGSVEGFAQMMNEKARDLGCKNTCFITPNGLDASVTGTDGNVTMHSTTAEELAMIMGYCVWQSPKKDDFLKITQTQNYYFQDLEGKGSYSCINHNAFLTMDHEVLSGKTGFTSGAGYSYVAALESEDRHFVIALLGCGWPPHKTYKWNDARILFRYGREKYRWCQSDQEVELPGLLVTDGIPESKDLGEPAHVGLTTRAMDMQMRFLMREGEKVEILVNLPENLMAPVEEGQLVGSVEYCLDGIVLRSIPIYTDGNVEKLTWSWCIVRVISAFFD